MNPAKILVVEDDTIVAHHIAQILGSMDYRVINTCGSGEEAMAAVAADCPDIVLMDIRLGGLLDGIETARRIKELVDTSIIYITSASDPETLEQAKQTDPIGYVLKPINDRDLLVTVKMADYRRQNDRELILSEKRFRLLANSTFEAIFLSEQGICIDQNQAAEEMFGYSKAEAIGRHATEWIHPNDREIVKQKLLQNETNAYQCRAVHKNGRVFDAEIQAKTIVENNRRIRITALRDITEQKKAENEILKFKQIFDNADFGMSIVTLQGQIQYINNSFAHSHGYSPEELIGQNLEIFHTPEQLPRVKQAITELFETGSYSMLEVWHQHRDGHVFPMLMNGLVVADEHGKPAFIAATAIDISGQKEMEIQIRESQERFRNTFEQAAVGITHVAPDGRLLRANQKFYDIVGYTPAELAVTSFEKITYPPDLDKEMVYITRMLAREIDTYTVEKRYIKKNGQLVWVNLTVSIVWDENDRVKYGIGVVQNIDYRKQIELELLKAKEEADAANRAKSVFLANMSHELRTPLNGILGYAQFLKLDPGLNEKQRSGIKVIEHSGQHLLSLINDILDLSKIEAGKFELVEEDINFPDFLQEIANVVEIRARCKKLKMIFSPDAQLPHKVRVDRKHLEQILLNLLSNAIKFTERGEIEFSIKSEGRGAKGDRVRFDVRDSGIGIENDQVEDIFKPFIQLSRHSKHSDGTGLGLSITRELVTRMGGQLQVESHPNKGSDFWFVLELADAAAGCHPDDQDLPTVHGYHCQMTDRLMLKILVVDDNDSNRQLIADVLDPLGFHVSQANDGREAVTMAENLAPDLIFMDLVMPGVDGYSATKLIREKDDNVKIIALSASSELKSADPSGHRFDGFLIKPFQLRDLYDCLQSQLRLEWITTRLEINEANDMVIPTELPDTLKIAQLMESVEIGDIFHAINLVEKWSEDDPALTDFARNVKQLGEDFLLNELSDFLRECRNRVIEKQEL